MIQRVKKWREKKPNQSIEPRIDVMPVKRTDGCFFRFKLHSQARKNMGTIVFVPWQGTELGFLDAVFACGVTLASHQYESFGDTWNPKEIGQLCQEAYKKLVFRFRELSQVQ